MTYDQWKLQTPPHYEETERVCACDQPCDCDGPDDDYMSEAQDRPL